MRSNGQTRDSGISQTDGMRSDGQTRDSGISQTDDVLVLVLPGFTPLHALAGSSKQSLSPVRSGRAASKVSVAAPKKRGPESC